MTRRHTIEGIPINTQGMDDLFARIRTWIRDGETPRIIVAANAAKLVAARRDIELRRALLAADWVLPDGMGVVWASRGEIPERLTGCDVAEGLLEHAAEQGWSVYLLGGRSHVVERAACVLRKRLPSLRLVGHHHGYLTEAAEAKVVASIAATAPAFARACTSRRARGRVPSSARPWRDRGCQTAGAAQPPAQLALADRAMTCRREALDGPARVRSLAAPTARPRHRPRCGARPRRRRGAACRAAAAMRRRERGRSHGARYQHARPPPRRTRP